MRLALVPLDTRPVTLALPRMIAEVAGAELVLPPSAALNQFREPGDHETLVAWLTEVVPEVDGLVVSIDQLVHGGLIPSRVSTAPATALLPRLDALRALRRTRADLPVAAFATVTRTPDADDATEEPAYWASYGRALHRLSALLDGAGPQAELDAARAAIPPGVTGDWLRRRLRNHLVNLGALELAAEGVADLLVLCSDDTAPRGLGPSEQRWLATWSSRLNLGDRVLAYPGTDEVAAVLVTRLILAAHEQAPRIEVRCVVDGGLDVIPPYEDVPLRTTIQRQVTAVGAVEGAPGGLGPGAAQAAPGDLVLAVHPPAAIPGDWAIGPLPDPEPTAPAAKALAVLVGALQRSGAQVAVADLAYPNGADPSLVAALAAHADLAGLAAYAGWNTAGNALGSALAQGCAGLLEGADPAANLRLLARRLLDDWAYQTRIRGERDPDVIAARLSAALGELPGLRDRVRLRLESVRLPWDRTFEVDFEVVDA